MDLDRENPIDTHGTLHLSMNDFANKAILASPGEMFVYAIGDIGYSGSRGRAKEEVAELKGVKDMAWGAYMRDEFHLTQSRLPDVPLIDNGTRVVGASFEYRATKRSVT